MRHIGLPLSFLLLGLGACGQGESFSPDGDGGDVATGGHESVADGVGGTADGSGGMPTGDSGSGGDGSGTEAKGSGGENDEGSGGTVANGSGGENDEGAGGTESNGTGGSGGDSSGGNTGAGGTESNGTGGSETGNVNCEGTVIDGDAILATQENVDAMAGVVEVTGSLFIDPIGPSLITSLKTLACLTKVGGEADQFGSGVWIERNTTLLNLDGLEALTSVGGSLILDNNDALENIDALSSLTSVGYDLLFRDNPALLDVDGLSSLKTVGGMIDFYGNDSLLQLSGLHNIESSILDCSVSDSTDLPQCELESLSNAIGAECDGSGNDGSGTCKP